jgi:DNA-binding NarL/FixJ family response regulator
MADKEGLVRIVIVEDDDLIRESFVSLLNDNERFICIADYDNCEDAIRQLGEDDPDLILMDIGLPGISGIEGIKRIKNMRPNIDILTVTVHDEGEKIFNALCAGATGYLTKNISPQKLIEAIDEVLNGGAPMSTNIARLVIRSFQRSNGAPILQDLLSGHSNAVMIHLLHRAKQKFFSIFPGAKAIL